MKDITLLKECVNYGKIIFSTDFTNKLGYYTIKSFELEEKGTKTIYTFHMLNGNILKVEYN